MFNRFRDSLVYPRRIINYRKDRFLKVLAYMVVFAVLMLSSTIVLIARFDRIPQTIRDQFQENLIEENIDCVVDDSVLTCVPEDTFEIFYSSVVGLINITMGVSDDMPKDEEIEVLSLSIFFSNDVVYLYYGGTAMEYAYDDLPDAFSTIDFSTISSDPEEFTNVMMDGFGDYVKSMGYIIVPLMLFMTFIGNMLMILFVVFLNAVILKVRFKVIPFKETFKMGVYMGTTLYMLLILNGFFGLGMFTIVIFLILTFRQTNALNMEIMKRIRK